MNDLQVLFYEGNKVRMVEMNGEPWWVLKDVCDVLALTEPHRVATRLDEDDRTQMTVTDSLGRNQDTTVVNESGLYNVIFRSDKPEAKKFKRWVTHEVLPSIRKTGGYGNVDLTAVIAQTAAAICSEMIRQMKPFMQPAEHPIHEKERTENKVIQRKRPSSIIDRLPKELRKRIEDMLCDGSYTYGEVAQVLREHGIYISITSVCRYAHRTGCLSSYEVRS